MESIGIVRKMDDLGRVVIPKEARTTLQFTEKEGQPLEFFVEKDRIILKKYQPGCVLCGSLDNVQRHKSGKWVCKSCMGGV